MKLDLKYVVKKWAYRSGLLGAYHRLRNRDQLTVVMFHRILPSHDPRYLGADPEWTMTPDSFTHCLAFFQRHYHVVSPDQVFSVLRGETKLPERSLLITFDDGWADTAEYAQPILDKFSMSSLIFVAGCALNQAVPFWEERIYSFLKTSPVGFSKLTATLKGIGIHIAALSSVGVNEGDIRNIIKQLGQIERLNFSAIASAIKESECGLSAMLDNEQLAQLVASSHTIGGHGMTHQALTKVANLEDELKNAQQIISAQVGKVPVESMSFPHGAYSKEIIETCHTIGYQYLFSSDAHLNSMASNSNASRPVGRIHISERAIINHTGQFEPAQLATWLFLRPSTSLDPRSELKNG